VSDLRFGDDLPDHTSSEELAAYLNGSVGVAGRDAIEAHLLECPECRRDVWLSRQILRRHRMRRRALTFGPVAVAAAIAFVMIAQVRSDDSTVDERLRNQGTAGADTATSIQIVTPRNDSTVEARTLAFVWRSEAGRPLYQLSLTDGSGKAIWSVETTDTTMSLPASVSLIPARTYFWTVDALAADGRSLTTRAQRFTTAR
jgi:hypothetical protein